MQKRETFHRLPGTLVPSLQLGPSSLTAGDRWLLYYRRPHMDGNHAHGHVQACSNHAKLREDLWRLSSSPAQGLTRSTHTARGRDCLWAELGGWHGSKGEIIRRSLRTEDDSRIAFWSPRCLPGQALVRAITKHSQPPLCSGGGRRGTYVDLLPFRGLGSYPPVTQRS